MRQTVAEIIKRWDSGEGKPYKGTLLDWESYLTSIGKEELINQYPAWGRIPAELGKQPPPDIGCMCAQGQILHLVAGWTPGKLVSVEQSEADKKVAKLLNISRAHAILLRNINDSVDGAPSIVLTDPEKILGPYAKQILAFWLFIDKRTWKQIQSINDRFDESELMRYCNRPVIIEELIYDYLEFDAAAAAIEDCCYHFDWELVKFSMLEIIAQDVYRERNEPFRYLPYFKISDPCKIPALPADYGVSL